MLERFKRSDGYSYVTQIEIPWENKFLMNLKDFEKKLEKFKENLFKKCSPELRKNVILTFFNRNPFKSCKYDQIGNFFNFVNFQVLIDDQGNTSLMKENPHLRIQLSDLDKNPSILEVSVFTKSKIYIKMIMETLVEKANSFNIKIIDF